MQLPEVNARGVYCYLCHETFEALDPINLMNRRKHLLSDHKHLGNEPILPCDICGKTFEHRDKRDLHPCIRLATAPLNYTTYYLKTNDMLLTQGLKISDLSIYDVVRICAEQCFCLPQYFPACYLPLQWRQGELYEHYKAYVNLNPSIFYEQVKLLFCLKCLSFI